MPACASFGKETPADQCAMTGDGPICKACHDERLVRAQDMRAHAATRLGRNDPENAFGDATFDPKKRKLAVVLFVVTLGLLFVLYALKLANLL